MVNSEVIGDGPTIAREHAGVNVSGCRGPGTGSRRRWGRIGELVAGILPEDAGSDAEPLSGTSQRGFFST